MWLADDLEDACLAVLGLNIKPGMRDPLELLLGNAAPAQHERDVAARQLERVDADVVVRLDQLFRGDAGAALAAALFAGRAGTLLAAALVFRRYAAVVEIVVGVGVGALVTLAPGTRRRAGECGGGNAAGGTR